MKYHPFVLLLLTLSGCSLLYDLGSDQCRTDQDCQLLGGDFVGRRCVTGLCVPRSSSGETSGDSSADASTSDDTSSTDHTSTDTPSQSTGSDDGGGDTVCTSHKQCIEEHFDEPYICQEGKCVGLITKECPIVLQPENLEVPEPIIIGAYSAINALDKMASPITRNYNLVLDEFTERVGGLAGGPNNTRRKLVAVVCEGTKLNESPLANSIEHLIDRVKVPAIVSSLFTADLREAFNPEDNVFFLSPLAADSDLVGQNNQGLLWFLLGQWSDLAPAYVALTKRAEAFQKEAAQVDEIRLALIEGSLTPARDIGQVLLSDAAHSLVFNGKTALDNGDAHFLFRSLTSDFVDDEADVSSVVQDLLEFKPHVVVVTAGTEFTTRAMPVIEAEWERSLGDAGSGQPPPFYVFSPFIAADMSLLDSANGDVRKRSAGINFAAAEDDTLYTAYRHRYSSMYGTSGVPPDGWENFYDVMYYMVYAIAAAGNPATLTGEHIAQGMLRIVSPTGNSHDVGPSAISSTLGALAVPNNRINLKGTMGPSDFTVGIGARHTNGSVWCTPSNGGGFLYDVLRFDEESGTLEGQFPCFPNF